MGQVTVTVGGREYTLACEDGEERHLAGLAQYLDGKAHFLVEQLGQISDMRLMLMAGLLVADELSDARARLDAVEAEIEALRRRAPAAPAAEGAGASEQEAASVIEGAARRIEDIAARLEAP
jgi:cell division protein ZapA